MKPRRAVSLLCLACFVLSGAFGHAQETQSDRPSTGAANDPIEIGLSGDPSAEASILSIDGSSIGTGYFTCYQAADYNRFCFMVQNGSLDGEMFDTVRMTFPDLLGAWDVTCGTQDPIDSYGNQVDLTCQVPAPNEVRYVDTNSNGRGEITSGVIQS